MPGHFWKTWNAVATTVFVLLAGDALLRLIRPSLLGDLRYGLAAAAARAVQPLIHGAKRLRAWWRSPEGVFTRLAVCLALWLRLGRIRLTPNLTGAVLLLVVAWLALRDKPGTSSPHQQPDYLFWAPYQA